MYRRREKSNKRTSFFKGSNYRLRGSAGAGDKRNKTRRQLTFDLISMVKMEKRGKGQCCFLLLNGGKNLASLQQLE